STKTRPYQPASWSSFLHVGPTSKLRYKKEGTNQMNQARRMQQGFKSGQVLFGRLSCLLAARSLPWQTLETGNQLCDWLEVWGEVFPQSPVMPRSLRREQQRSVPFDLIPGGPDSMGRLLPLLLSDPVPGRFEEDPQPVPILEELKAEHPPPRFPVPVCGRVRGRTTLICRASAAPLQVSRAPLQSTAARLYHLTGLLDLVWTSITGLAIIGVLRGLLELRAELCACLSAWP
ncbi:hypothetical protein CRENBAI_019226, partial [Crenichthys baileyi]